MNRPYLSQQIGIFLLFIISLMLALPSHAMTKSELVGYIAGDANLSKADAKRALEGFVTSTTSSLNKGSRVQLIGFGTFSISSRAARTGRNPQTGMSLVAKYGAGVRATMTETEDGRAEFLIRLSRGYLRTHDQIHLVPVTAGARARVAAADSGMPDEYIFELPSNMGNTVRRRLTLRFDMPMAALRGTAGMDGRTPLFDGADALLNYLPIMRNDVYQSSVVGGDLEEAADALDFCSDAFVDLEANAVAMPFGHVTVLKAMSAQTGLTEDQADDFINTIMGYGGNDPIVRKKPGRTMVGFGSFSISKRAARVGRNPQTGKEIQIKAKNVVKFKAGSDLSGKVN